MIPIKDYPGPRRNIPWVTWTLIAINIAVFIYQVSLGTNVDEFMYAYSVVPKALILDIPQTSLPGAPADLPFHTPGFVYLTAITSMFMHAGILHIAGNMLYLFIFGDNVEDRMGPLLYLLFYLFCGIIATIAQVAVDPNSTIPNLGASGAIAGVLAAYLVLFPLAGVRTVIFIFIFFTVITVPAIFLIGFWFLLQLFNGYASLANVQQGGVAYMAHVGGFVAGLIITLLARPWLKEPPPITYPSFPRHPQSAPHNQ